MNDRLHPEKSDSYYEEAGEEFGVYTPAAARELTVTDHQKREQEKKAPGEKEQEDRR
ncbi:hypothetical protein [Alkalihalobacillus sp. R86527]|uniref:hypothetical protein n=1 Tax=Alkalihalobacillus sp. R86527 TaxID=3093863 RepID=UPI003671AE3C